LANATTKEGKVNFEGIGSTGYVAGGPTAWLAVANGFLKNKSTIYLIFKLYGSFLYFNCQVCLFFVIFRKIFQNNPYDY
jgi:hypothetical protein